MSLVALPLPIEINLLIYSLLSNKDLCSLRQVSRLTYIQVKNTEFGKKIERIQRINSVLLKQTLDFGIMNSFFLHSNGNEMRALSFNADQLWKFASDATSSPQLISLQKIKYSKQIYWNTNQIAISQSFIAKGNLTTIINTETGKCLKKMFHVRDEPVNWYGDHSLLMQDQNHIISGGSPLLIWDVLSENAPLEVCSHNVKDVQVSKRGDIYCRDKSWHQKNPFVRVDIEKGGWSSLAYSPCHLISGGSPINNFATTDEGCIFFSHSSAITFLNKEGSACTFTLNAPIIPEKIVYQFPLTVCSKDHRFLIYDMRKPAKALYDHNYVTWKREIKNFFSPIKQIVYSMLNMDMNDDLIVRSLVLHQDSLFVRRDHLIDHFDLTAAQPWYRLG